jgi:hypothetical protein
MSARGEQLWREVANAPKRLHPGSPAPWRAARRGDAYEVVAADGARLGGIHPQLLPFVMAGEPGAKRAGGAS